MPARVVRESKLIREGRPHSTGARRRGAPTAAELRARIEQHAAEMRERPGNVLKRRRSAFRRWARVKKLDAGAKKCDLL